MVTLIPTLDEMLRILESEEETPNDGTESEETHNSDNIDDEEAARGL